VELCLRIDDFEGPLYAAGRVSGVSKGGVIANHRRSSGKSKS
jgi:hypothetical protein